MSLIGQVAIVTGASNGIGKSIAKRLAQDGCAILVADIDAAGAEITAKAITEDGGTAIPYVGDMSKISDIKEMFTVCLNQLGQPDILVADAGISFIKPLNSITEEDYYHVYELNTKGTLFCIKEAGEKLKEGGRIIVISSSTTRYPIEGMSIYASSKAAQKMMVEVAAQELAYRGITVNSVLPGLTATPAVMKLPEEFRNTVIAAAPFKRLGTPEDIAETVAFLASKNSQWISGQHILSNGGSKF